MTNSVYQINKGVNRPIVFRGLKAQWIAWLGGGLLALLLLFALLYLVGVSMVVCSIIVLVLGSCLFWWVYKMNRLYGQYGWMKQMALRFVPVAIKCDQLFQ